MNKMFNLTDEQREFLNQAVMGKNILVDACIGSGKTTAIQELCKITKNKKILYLTYNTLLKIDAKEKIKNRNVTVTNYHGFAFNSLRRIGIDSAPSDQIQNFNKSKPPVSNYDMLVIDEYQDIEQEIAEMLVYIKSQNPYIQIIAVGDMEQKIYDKTTLQVVPFIEKFLEDYIVLHFTKCFRLCSDLAEKLGRIWQKKIIGINPNCHVRSMTMKEAEYFLSQQKPNDILCLGPRYGTMATVLNNLENNYPNIFNKSTVYASIRDKDSNTTKDDRIAKTAIFTTYDSSKGLERPICVVFGYTEEYWKLRIEKPRVDYKILRNIFCVAASRGKEQIIFVTDPDKKGKWKETPLSEKTLSTPTDYKALCEDMDISTMFDFKYKEDIEECYRQLSISKVEQADKSEINIKNHDELIDLSPCIGVYQEARFFNKYDIDKEIAYSQLMNPERPHLKYDTNASIEDKVLLLTAYETYQDRYVTQVKKPFVTNEQMKMICSRLNTIFKPDESVQVLKSMCVKNLNNKRLFSIDGKCDVLTNEYVYELKFVSELKHEHFLQCACYMVMLGMTRGRLWNVRNNEMYEITIPNKSVFMEKVVKTITKGKIKQSVTTLNAKIRKERKSDTNKLLLEFF